MRLVFLLLQVWRRKTSPLHNSTVFFFFFFNVEWIRKMKTFFCVTGIYTSILNQRKAKKKTFHVFAFFNINLVQYCKLRGRSRNSDRYICIMNSVWTDTGLSNCIAFALAGVRERRWLGSLLSLLPVPSPSCWPQTQQLVGSELKQSLSLKEKWNGLGAVAENDIAIYSFLAFFISVTCLTVLTLARR